MRQMPSLDLSARGPALFGCGISISHLECRAILGPRSAVVVDPRRSDVGVAEPFLNPGDVGVVIERVGGGSRTQCMHSDLESKLRRIGAHQLVDAIRGDRCFEAAGTDVPGRPKQCTADVSAMSGGVA